MVEHVSNIRSSRIETIPCEWFSRSYSIDRWVARYLILEQTDMSKLKICQVLNECYRKGNREYYSYVMSIWHTDDKYLRLVYFMALEIDGHLCH